MPSGTITLTNNSKTVNGTGTKFTAELKANDFIVVVVGGVTYTLGIAAVASDTSLTLITAYNGPDASGLAWTPVPNQTMVGITAQIAADTARAIRGLNYDKNNWQQVFSGAGDITVKLPDASEFTGPSWNYLASELGSCQKKIEMVAKTASGALFSANNLSDLPDKDSARKNIGLGSTNNVYFAGIACRQGTLGYFGSNKFNFFWNAQGQMEAWVDSTRVGVVTLTAVTSDRGLKRAIRYVDDSESAYEQVANWRVAKFKYRARGIIPESDELLGFIANDLIQQSPECVQGKGLPEDYDITKDPNNPDAYVLNQTAMVAKLTQALQVAMLKIDALEKSIAKKAQKNQP